MAEKNLINLKNILLLESSFIRSWIIDFENESFNNDVDVQIESTRNDPYLHIVVNLNFSAGIADDKQITAFIKMVGVFEMGEGTEQNIDQFSNVNAPAIIFPFLREHLASLSIKAGISPIMLAPVNFVKLAEEKNL